MVPEDTGMGGKIPEAGRREFRVFGRGRASEGARREFRV